MRRIIDVGIVLWLFTLLSTGLPQFVPGVPAVERVMWPLADRLGLAQGSWTLFAPNPDHINTWVEIELTSDGQTQTSWTTPDWRSLSELERIQHIRWYKFADKLRSDDGAFLRRPVLDYALRQTPAPEGETWVLAKMYRHFWVVPRPSQAATHAVPKPWPPPRDLYPRKVLMTQKPLKHDRERPPPRPKGPPPEPTEPTEEDAP